MNLNKDLSKYLELNVLPNLLAFSLARLFYNNSLTDESLDCYYNSIKSLINLVNENKDIVLKIAKHILSDKYNLLIVDEKHLRIIRIT